MVFAHTTGARAIASLTAVILLTSAGVSSSRAATVAKPKATKAATVGGVAKTESALTGAKGTWTGSPTFTYKWYACTVAGTAKTAVPSGCTAIPGATKPAFTIAAAQEGKHLRFATTAKNRGGTTISVSAATAKVTSPYTLLWSDEFNGPAGLSSSVQTSNEADDTSKPWKTTISGAGGGNYERQYYTDGVVQYNTDGSVAKYAVQLDGNGNLQLNAAKPQSANDNHAATGVGASCWYGTACEFLSGRIDTRDRIGFKNGLLEARVKIPSDSNTWPAFWMLGANYGTVGWPSSGEIDIMETAFTPGRAYTYFGSLHAPYYYGGFPMTKVMPDFNLYSGYHTFGVLRTPSKVEFRFDGKPFYTATKAAATALAPAGADPARIWPFDQEFYMILNLAMGGTLGGFSGSGTANGSVGPSATGGTLGVDWVRFSSVNGEGEVIRH